MLRIKHAEYMQSMTHNINKDVLFCIIKPNILGYINEIGTQDMKKKTKHV